MISTNFMVECEGCPNLEVAQDTLAITCDYIHTITCVHMDKCRLLKEHLRKEMQKNGN